MPLPVTRPAAWALSNVQSTCPDVEFGLSIFHHMLNRDRWDWSFQELEFVVPAWKFALPRMIGVIRADFFCGENEVVLFQPFLSGRLRLVFYFIQCIANACKLRCGFVQDRRGVSQKTGLGGLF